MAAPEKEPRTAAAGDCNGSPVIAMSGVETSLTLAQLFVSAVLLMLVKAQATTLSSCLLKSGASFSRSRAVRLIAIIVAAITLKSRMVVLTCRR